MAESQMNQIAVTLLRHMVDLGCWVVHPSAVRCFYCGVKEGRPHVDCAYAEAARFFGEEVVVDAVGEWSL